MDSLIDMDIDCGGEVSVENKLESLRNEKDSGSLDAEEEEDEEDNIELADEESWETEEETGAKLLDDSDELVLKKLD